MLSWIVLLGIVGIVIVYATSSIHSRCLVQRSDTPVSALDLAKHENETRKTHATVLGVIGVGCTVAAGVSGKLLEEKKFNYSRFASAVELLGSESESSRMAGVLEVIQSKELDPSRGETVNGVLLSFVEREMVSAARREVEDVDEKIDDYMAGLDESTKVADVSPKFKRLARVLLTRDESHVRVLSQMEDDLHQSYPDVYHRIIEMVADARAAVSPEVIKSIVYLAGQSVRVDTSGLRFYGNDFSGADFRGISFIGCRFENCNFSDAVFGDADLSHTEFLNSRLPRARFESVDFSGARFQDCNLVGTTFADCDPTGILEGGIRGNGGGPNGMSFDFCDLTGASFTRVDLKSARFGSTHLTDVQLVDTDLADASFVHCLLDGARFTRGAFDNVAELHWEQFDAKSAISSAAQNRFSFRRSGDAWIITGPKDRVTNDSQRASDEAPTPPARIEQQAPPQPSKNQENGV